MTKTERRKAQLERHYAALKALAAICGLKDVDGKKLSTKLWKLEEIAHNTATDYCNGKIDTDAWASEEIFFERIVQEMFNNNLKGLYINGDARGYTLKIASELMVPGGLYAETGLQTDWGGYGLLAPEITGE